MGYVTADLGGSSAPLDSSAEVREALNAGLRHIVKAIPFTVADTVTIASNTFLYSLNSNFAPDKQVSMPIEIIAVNSKGTATYGVPIKKSAEFGMVPFAPGLIAGAAIQGQTLHIFPAAPAGDKLYVYGPGDITAITGAGSLLAPVPRRHRWAAVYWAIMLLSQSRGESGLYQEAQQAYGEEVANARAAVAQ